MKYVHICNAAFKHIHKVLKFHRNTVIIASCVHAHFEIVGKHVHVTKIADVGILNSQLGWLPAGLVELPKFDR